jgi:hypothetical protein
MDVVSFVDRDMVMRYFGGGIGHLKNAPPLLGFGPIDTNSEEMPVEEDGDIPCSGTNEDLGTIVQQPLEDVMNSDDEDEEHNEEDNDTDGDEDGDQTDVDEDEEGEDDYGYASP